MTKNLAWKNSIIPNLEWYGHQMLKNKLLFYLIHLSSHIMLHFLLSISFRFLSPLPFVEDLSPPLVLSSSSLFTIILSQFEFSFVAHRIRNKSKRFVSIPYFVQPQFTLQTKIKKIKK